jgi:hypothetical protein
VIAIVRALLLGVIGAVVDAVGDALAILVHCRLRGRHAWCELGEVWICDRCSLVHVPDPKPRRPARKRKRTRR